MDVGGFRKNIYKLKILEIMKKLEDFTTEKVELKNIFGGKIVPTGSSSRDANGCLVETFDSFDDANGNGKRDVDESYESCTAITC